MADLPTLDAIHNKTKIPMRHLVQLQERGYLPAQKPDKTVSAILASLRKHPDRPLPPDQALWLLFNRDKLPVILEKRKKQIDDQLSDLGDIKADAAPWSIASRVGLAAGHDVESVALLAQWARGALSTLPAGQTVPYAWLACRLLINAPGHHLPLLVRSLIKAIQLIRKHPAMSGCWHTVEHRVAYHSSLALDL